MNNSTTCMLSLFIFSTLTKAKLLVQGSFNAQSIYRELQEYATNSTQVVIDSNTLYITTLCIDDGSWNGMIEKFILHWMEQLCLYEDLVDLTAALVDAVKLTLITNAVRGHPQNSVEFTMWLCN